MLAAATERYDTRQVPPEARLGYWREIVARTSSPATFDDRNPETLHCALTRAVFDRFSVSHVVTSEVRASRGRQHGGTPGGSSFLYLQLEGEGELVSIGRTMRTAPGSMILFDEETPYRYHLRTGGRILSVGLPSSLLAARLPFYREIAMRSIDTGAGTSQVLAATLRSIAGMFVDQGVRRFPPALFGGLIELMSAITDEDEPCDDNLGTMTRWAGKVRAYVEMRLDDCELTPASIARHFGISPRYLRLIFARGAGTDGEGETLRRYILRRRLEECAARLVRTDGRVLSITQLAHGWGFSDSSYFARRFLEQYGVTPSAYRGAILCRPADMLAGTC
ncbi:helix-turn-helix domain-containing protein [Sphingomonas sp. MMS24-J13]|uniref:helix-turn-helix domain-containing protein n=1 Tax=Sphingomonas sp. MMS24-J13 TaxID=3238686 RepID=UPI00384AE013